MLYIYNKVYVLPFSPNAVKEGWESVGIGIFHRKIGISPWHFHKLPLNLHAKIQKNIRKNSIMEKKDVSLQ